MGRPTPALLAQADQAEAQYRLPAGLVSGLIEVESGWDPQAVGHNPRSVDRGLVQINSLAHPDVTPGQAFDPSFAIPWAAKELAGLIARCGSVTGGLEAYNSGRCQGDTGYASAVLSAARRYGYTGAAWQPRTVWVLLLGAAALVVLAL